MTGFGAATLLTGETPLGPGEPIGFGPGVAAVPCCCGLGCATLTCETMPGVATGAGDAAAIGIGLTTMADGCGMGVAGLAVGAALRIGCGVRGAWLGTALGRGDGAAVGGALIVTATVVAGAVVGTCAGIGAGETAMTACVGTGFGASELTGAGVGFGGAVGANFESSCRTCGCGGAERGCAAATGFGTTVACGTGGETFATLAGALDGTGRVLTVMTMPPSTDSGACADDDVATEKRYNATSA